MTINHSKNDLNNYYKFIFFLCIPFIVYGLYKNSLMVYLESKQVLLLVKPIISLILSLGLGFLMDYKFTKTIKVNRFTISALFLWMILPVGTPFWLYVAGFGILWLSLLKLNDFVHPIMLSKLFCVLILFLLSKYSYQNYYEASGLYVYSFTDLFFKNQVGGIATSNLILVIISFIILLFHPLYKKNISVPAIASYIVVLLLFALFISEARVFELILSASILFEMVMIAPLNEYSSYTLKGQWLFGVFVGLFGALVSVLALPYEGIAIVVVIASIIKKLFDKKFLLN
ncbi:MAG: RnfABCDGE type electron transport complex subunit D [Bacilli bacterium]|nr:RnfABCDGE type electron transport complex subunit D [Bacilli bacterium]